MPNDGKIQKLIFLLILNLIILVFSDELSNLAYAELELYQKLHEKTLDEISKQSSEQNPHIPVGNTPQDIVINEQTNTIYVANQVDNTVSVINGINNTKIGNDIQVGEAPKALGVNPKTNTIYVVNTDDSTVSIINGKNNTKTTEDIEVRIFPEYVKVDTLLNKIFVRHGLSDTVSVIDGKNNTRVEDIKKGDVPLGIGATSSIYVSNYEYDTISVFDRFTGKMVTDDIQVGAGPTDIAVNLHTHLIYVVNQDDNSVSVIGLKNNTKIGDDIKVGNYPRAIAINEPTNTIYVTNWEDGTVSVIDGETNKVVAKVDFNIEPFIGGLIECDKDKGKSITPIAQEFYVYSGSECIAKPNKGFEFLSWEENLNNNSTQIINVSRPASTLESIKDFFNIKSEEPEAKLKITKFGSFTANFKELPPPIPTEFWLQSYVLVGTVIAGLSIPSIVGWIKSKMDARKLNSYHKKIASLYRDDGKLNENDIKRLNLLRNSILNAYSEGKLNEKHYESLKNETSILYTKIYRNRINDH